MSSTEPAPLLAGFRGLVCDLDGVVYAGPAAIPHAVPALERARETGAGIVYATNNGSRPPQDVADHLTELGLTVTLQSIVISAQAAAAHLRERLGEGAAVLGVGGPGVAVALAGAGLRLVTTAESAQGEPVAGVLQSYGRDVAWSDLAEISYVVNGGALWVASNDDLTLPTARGVAPGNGSLVRVVRAAVAVDPVVVGKPHTPLYDLSAAVLGTPKDQTLAIGDRLDTDIEGANRAGIPALLVLTGVNDLADVALAPAVRRPAFLARDLRALAEPYVAAEVAPADRGHAARCGGVEARLTDEGPVFSGDGSVDERARALVAACWAAVDAGSPPSPDALRAADPTKDGSP
ncbi:MAG: HAD-IIA family hydrolase [Austwickia sp.]|nr:MAG: HAD-IIA family hydrolase [Austwickia sp.]